MDFTPLYKHAPLGALHFAPSGAFLAHAVGPRLVVRDSENFGISRVWDLKHGGKEWKSVDYIAWNADGLLLAANYAQGLVRVYCPDTVLEAELVGDSNEREWECDIDAGESVAAVRWGPNAQIWVWEEFNVRRTSFISVSRRSHFAPRHVATLLRFA